MICVFDCDPNGRKERAARRWFAKHGPRDLQPLPLGYDDRESLKRARHYKQGNASYILALYARSLEGADYDVLKHPSFQDYACGLMASDFAHDFIRNDEAMQKRFPPRTLPYLASGALWQPPRRGRPRSRRQLKVQCA
jgi:hypothetical protein